jgi:hypothetical protein
MPEFATRDKHPARHSPVEDVLCLCVPHETKGRAVGVTLDGLGCPKPRNVHLQIVGATGGGRDPVPWTSGESVPGDPRRVSEGGTTCGAGSARKCPVGLG